MQHQRRVRLGNVYWGTLLPWRGYSQSDAKLRPRFLDRYYSGRRAAVCLGSKASRARLPLLDHPGLQQHCTDRRIAPNQPPQVFSKSVAATLSAWNCPSTVRSKATGRTATAVPCGCSEQGEHWDPRGRRRRERNSIRMLKLVRVLLWSQQVPNDGLHIPGNGY